MRVRELFEIDAGRAANQAVQQAANSLRTMRQTAERDLDANSRAFLAAYRTIGAPANLLGAMTTTVNAIVNRERPPHQLIVLASLFRALRDAIVEITREQRGNTAGNQVEQPGAAEQLAAVIREFANNNQSGDEYTEDMGQLLQALQPQR